VNKDGENGLLQFPDTAALKEEVLALRSRIAELFAELQDLEDTECKNIESDYLLTFGALEQQVFEASCYAKRVRRKLEMVRACLAQGEAVVESEIEEELDREFASYQREMHERIQRVKDALDHSRGHFLSGAEDAEIKAIYRRLVKELHPDLHPNQTPAMELLFRQVVDAYKQGDLKQLELLSEMIRIRGNDLPKTAQLPKEKARLEKIAADLEARMEDIKSKEPYTLKVWLEDPQRHERIEELKKQCTEWEEQAQKTEDELAKLLEG